MNFKEIDRGELIALAGGILLVISLFLAWYSLGNENTTLNACKGPNSTCTGWQSLSVFRYVLLVVAASPVFLVWVILRGHALGWPRGELTAVIGLLALMMVLFRGVIDKPGSPRSEISPSIGFFIALVGSLLMLLGSLYRSQEAGAERKPPGVL
jgi:hypothetical protein